MNDKKIKNLFHVAKTEAAPQLPFAFSQRVAASIQLESREPTDVSIFDLLNQLFPKVAVASLIVIGACFASDLLMTEKHSNLSTGFVEVTEQWLFAAN